MNDFFTYRIENQVSGPLTTQIHETEIMINHNFQ